MESGFGWLSSLMESVGHLFPRFKHVQKNQTGVMFTRGSARPIGPGMHWYWPVWSRPDVHSSVRQTITLETQTLTTSDGKSVCCRSQIVLRVVDPMAAFVDTSSVEEAVVDIATGGVKAVISKTSLQDLILRSRAVDAAISRRIRAELKVFGVEVIRAFLSDFSPAKVICLVKD